MPCRVQALYTSLITADAQLRKQPLPDVLFSEGYSCAGLEATPPIGHDLKQALRFMIKDILLLV